MAVDQLEYQLVDGRFTRKFVMPPSVDGSTLTNQQLGSAIAEYIQMFNEMLQLYFEHLSPKTDLQSNMKYRYQQYLQNSSCMI